MIETRFKDTEIGKIPEEWEVSSFGEQFKKLNAASYTWKETSKEGDCAYLHYGEIHTKYHDHLNVKGSDLPYISCSQARNFTKLQNGDLVMLNASEDYEGVNDCVEIENCDKDLVAGQHTIPLRPTKDKFEKGFIGYIPSIPIVRNQIVENAVGTKVYGVTNEMLKTIFIPLPTKVEQRRIATALSNVDALIAAVEKKIEKKKLIKQGAMQQLLTGKKRLPGYEGEWVEKRLGDLLEYEQPIKYIVKSTDYDENGIPVLTAGKSFILGYTNEETGIYSNLPVILFDDFLTCSRYIDFKFKVKSSAVKMLYLKDSRYNLRLIYELMQTIDFPALDHQRYWINQFSKLKVLLPSDPSEQRAIASILSNMDSEITALERKRDKLKELKHGMMQQLLTGKIRLVRGSG